MKERLPARIEKGPRFLARCEDCGWSWETPPLPPGEEPVKDKAMIDKLAAEANAKMHGNAHGHKTVMGLLGKKN